jgi:hypothetical protein
MISPGLAGAVPQSGLEQVRMHATARVADDRNQKGPSHLIINQSL